MKQILLSWELYLEIYQYQTKQHINIFKLTIQQLKGPIPLRDYQMQSPDQFEVKLNMIIIITDILRKMKIKQEQNKIIQQAKELSDQKNLLQQREAMRRLMQNNKDKNFTYDYDGKIILANKGNPKKVANQENIVGISYKISTTSNVVKKLNQEQPLKITPKFVETKESIQNKQSVQSIQQLMFSQSNSIQAQLQSQPSTYDIMLENIKPSQGVIFRGAKGEIKAGEGYNNSQSQIDLFDSQKYPNDIKRMTRKEYDEFIRNSGNYSRNESYNKPRLNNYQNVYRNNSKTENNNFEDILDGINYSQIQPIEEQIEEDLHLKQKIGQQYSNNVLQNIQSRINYNKGSLKMAGINLIQKQNSCRVNSNNNAFRKNIDIEYQNENNGNRYSMKSMTILQNQVNTQFPKRRKAGSIQIADEEKLRAMLSS